jgi:Sulfotransferase domain
MSLYRQIRFKAARTPLFRAPLIWLRHRGLDPRDVFLASYPRSGQFWLRFQLVEILTGQSGEFDNVDKVVPKVGLHSKVPAILPVGGRMIQTHEKYRKEYNKVIYLVRDFRDVVLSEFLQAKSSLSPLPLYIDDFDTYLLASLRGKVQAFGPWHEHVHSWLDSPLEDRGNLLVVKFEGLRRNPKEILLQILEFLNVSADPELVQNVVANNSLEKMRAKEDRRTVYKVSTEEDRHVHGGVVCGWRQKLTHEQIQLIHQYAGKALARMGYSVAEKETGDQPRDLRYQGLAGSCDALHP